jgi:hypothetical protein
LPLEREIAIAWEDAAMTSDITPNVSALAINVTIPEGLRWTDSRRGEEFTLTTLNIRLLPDGRLATKAYGRPTAGGRGTYVSLPVPSTPELATWSAKLQATPARCGPPTAVSAEGPTVVTAAEADIHRSWRCINIQPGRVSAGP